MPLMRLRGKRNWRDCSIEQRNKLVTTQSAGFSLDCYERTQKPFETRFKKRMLKIFVTKKPFYCGRLEMSMVT